MFEKVNPAHPDKIADRIAGALVDLAYKKDENPRIAVEILIGHGTCHIVAETSVHFEWEEVAAIVERIAGHVITDYKEYPQDEHLAENQSKAIKCGDNGIFKGMPVTDEQRKLTTITKALYDVFGSDGKCVVKDKRLVICQSNATFEDIKKFNPAAYELSEINPLGYWTGGTNVDTGATNRKLGSDMGDSITGGGLHGKDLSKADVSVNIFAFVLAQILEEPVELCCAIGDSQVNGIPYESIVESAREFIDTIGGFEKFAEWGLIR